LFFEICLNEKKKPAKQFERSEYQKKTLRKTRCKTHKPNLLMPQ